MTEVAAKTPQVKVGVEARVHRRTVAGVDDLRTGVSKAPRATVVIPELADEDSPEGWQVMGQTDARITGTVKEMLEKALHDLTHEIPPEYRDLPQVREQCEQLRGLVEGSEGSWPFTVELHDPIVPGGMEGFNDGEAPPWVQAFLDGEDGKGSAFLDAQPASLPACELGAPEGLRRCVIAPGNGCDSIWDSNWYGWLAEELGRRKLFNEVVCRDFPDPHEAKRSSWIPFLRDDLKVGPDTVLVGHSSGAQAAMRFAEDNVIGGLVLVAACHTDLGDEGERASGYYPPAGGEWKWVSIRKNVGWIVQFHSSDDPLVPVGEGREVARCLGSDYRELDGKVFGE
eukprot:TRINITY_DN38781_c0_g1_i2.p1 TRINITY_DN38781_c0_g1~~TRINITY_DN38781_c0_g1_i2.p1  ORF type:complete len:341 (-),score=45.71 TRINITY_DN38781_c0_g1_i2:22-1044(-)